DGSEERLKTSLASTLARGAALAPTHEDLTIDRIVGTRQEGYFPAERLIELMRALSSCSELWLETERVRASSEAISPRVVVADDGADAVAVVVDRDPRVTEVVAGEIVRIGDTLHPMAESELTGPRFEKLPLRRVYKRDQLGTVVTEVLPDLAK